MSDGFENVRVLQWNCANRFVAVTGEDFPGVDPEFRTQDGINPSPIQRTVRELLNKVDPGVGSGNGNAGMFTQSF